MISDFINRISTVEKIKRTDLIEKDILLHRILLDLSKEKSFSSNFLFKGGTCLIKHYVGYVRFSEDIDFTWKDQSRFDGKSGRNLDKDLAVILDKTGTLLASVADRRGLDFKYEKGNRDYVELVSGGKICTLKFWYKSVMSEQRKLLKIQINFVDKMCSNPRRGDLKIMCSITTSFQLLDMLIVSPNLILKYFIA